MRKFYDYNRPYRFTAIREYDDAENTRSERRESITDDVEVSSTAERGAESPPLSYKARRYLAMMNRHDSIVNSITAKDRR